MIEMDPAKLSKKLSAHVDHEGFDGLAKLLLKTLDSIAGCNWYSKNQVEALENYLESDEDIGNLPSALDGWED